MVKFFDVSAENDRASPDESQAVFALVTTQWWNI